MAVLSTRTARLPPTSNTCHVSGNSFVNHNIPIHVQLHIFSFFFLFIFKGLIYTGWNLQSLIFFSFIFVLCFSLSWRSKNYCIYIYVYVARATIACNLGLTVSSMYSRYIANWLFGPLIFFFSLSLCLSRRTKPTRELFAVAGLHLRRKLHPHVSCKLRKLLLFCFLGKRRKCTRIQRELYTLNE